MDEAELISNYLINKPLSNSTRERYYRAIAINNIQLDNKEEKIWRLIKRFPFLLHFFDAALAIKNPDGNIRYKIFIMLSILECEKEFADYFLPKKFHPLYIFKIGFTGIMSILKLIVGLILLAIL